MSDLIRIASITEMHKLSGLAEPKHPLITLIEADELKEYSSNNNPEYTGLKMTFGFYSIMFKDRTHGSMTYGRTSYDFQNGTMVFMSPDQVIEWHDYDIPESSKTWFLMFHPDLIRRYSLAKHIESYSFFEYDSNEALHLSVDEQDYLAGIVKQIKKEYLQNIDSHSHQLIISNLELLLNYCLRYYDRQFFTRSSFNKDFVSEFEQLLKKYFSTDSAIEKGIPTVAYFSDKLNMSANYLSDLLKKETGTSVKGHINKILIEKAKNALLNSNESVSEIAYCLGFKHPQSLTRLFKSKTGLSPSKYRNLN